MDIQALKSIFEDFDLAAFLPELTTVIGWVESLLRLCVMAAPVILLVLGLVYLVRPPKEANYLLGYRFWWSMASLDAWQFTHKLVGYVWSALGLVLTIIMLFVTNSFRKLEPMDMVWRAAKAMLWELGLIAVACIAVNIVVMVTFDKDGFRRKEEY